MKHPVPPKGNARHIAQPDRTSKPIPGATAKPSRRDLIVAGAALATAVAARAEVTSAAHPDAELIRLADLAADARRQYCAALSDEVDIPPEVDAELDRLSAVARDCFLRSAAFRATTDAGRRAKAQIVTLAHSGDLACDGIADPAAVALESLLDDLMGGEGACAAFDWHVHHRGDVA